MTFKEFYQKTELDKYDKFVDDLTKACKGERTILKTLGKIGEFDLYRITVNPGKVKTLLIGASMHGNEPAGAYSVIKFLEEHNFPKDLRIIIFPCMNPHGFALDDRFALKGKDLNRQWAKKERSDETKLIYDSLNNEKIDFFLSLHEDDTQKGFYVYLSSDKLRKMTKPIFEIAASYMKINSQKSIYGDHAEEGVIVVDKKVGNCSSAKNSIESWVEKTFQAPYICTETISSIPLQWRINVNKQIIQYVVDNVFAEEKLKKKKDVDKK